MNIQFPKTCQVFKRCEFINREARLTQMTGATLVFVASAPLEAPFINRSRVCAGQKNKKYIIYNSDNIFV